MSSRKRETTEEEVFNTRKIAHDNFERQNRLYYPVGIPRSEEKTTRTNPVLKELKVPPDFRQGQKGNDTSR